MGVVFQGFFDEFVRTVWGGDTLIHLLTPEELKTFQLMFHTTLIARQDESFLVQHLPLLINKREHLMAPREDQFSFFEAAQATHNSTVHPVQYYDNTYWAHGGSYRFEVDALIETDVQAIVVQVDKFSGLLGKPLMKVQSRL